MITIEEPQREKKETRRTARVLISDHWVKHPPSAAVRAFEDDKIILPLTGEISYFVIESLY